MKPYRKPTHTEYSIIHQLLSVVEDRNEKERYLHQIQDLEVKEIDDDGSLELKISHLEFRDSNTQARAIAEGILEVPDNHYVTFILHGRDGLLSELEIFKDDFSKITEKIDGNLLHVIPK